MKLNLVFTAILLSTLLMASCKKNEDDQKNENYLIFGHYYGECGGETCIEIYCLESSRLLEDLNDNYPSSQNFYNANFTELPYNDFLEVNDLMSFFS